MNQLDKNEQSVKKHESAMDKIENMTIVKKHELNMNSVHVGSMSLDIIVSVSS
jgi:hypothetical protein